MQPPRCVSLLVGNGTGAEGSCTKYRGSRKVVFTFFYEISSIYSTVGNVIARHGQLRNALFGFVADKFGNLMPRDARETVGAAQR